MRDKMHDNFELFLTILICISVLGGFIYFAMLPTPSECSSVNMTWTIFGCVS